MQGYDRVQYDTVLSVLYCTLADLKQEGARGAGPS